MTYPDYLYIAPGPIESLLVKYDSIICKDTPYHTGILNDIVSTGTSLKCSEGEIDIDYLETMEEFLYYNGHIQVYVDSLDLFCSQLLIDLNEQYKQLLASLSIPSDIYEFFLYVPTVLSLKKKTLDK